jgi:DNA-binding transcriptional LysR family regulator
MKVTLKQLEVFRAVVMSGSISNARKLVGLAQPTISQQLSKMEEILGTQLIRRGQTQGIEMTPAGEFWFRAAETVLEQITAAEATHKVNFCDRQLDLRFGTTPSLRGFFLEEAAKAALKIGKFSRFEFVWALSSDEVVKMILAHRINCGVVSAMSTEQHNSSLNIQPLFNDEIVWVVPRNIPEEMIVEVLTEPMITCNKYDALNRYVDVGPGIPWSGYSDDWFRSKLPNAAPYFSCMTHQAAVDIVAGGMATCHSPLALLPNLSAEVLSRIKCFRLNEYVRKAVLVMPKHLLTLQPFADFAEHISTYFSERYLGKAFLDEMQDFPELCTQINSFHDRSVNSQRTHF